jgi:hypothetical protein
MGIDEGLVDRPGVGTPGEDAAWRSLRERGVGPEPALALAASHPWDCAGAGAAGLVSASANRSVPHGRPSSPRPPSADTTRPASWRQSSARAPGEHGLALPGRWRHHAVSS